jgi:hypothetical protein
MPKKNKTNNTNNKINKINKSNRKFAKTVRNLHNRLNNIQNKNRRLNRNKMPAANTKNMNRDFRILYQDGNTVRVTGRDLVYQIPSDIVSQYNSDIITVIPANPCYWLGTRIAALAQGYQNYRPLSIKFNYIPQCAVTQQGNVIAGTLWNQAPSNVNLQQSLRTSNGGQLSQCYKPFTSIVRMKTNLQYNLYKTAGQFDQESNPFIYIAMSVGCLNENKQNIVPGYFYVTWSFVLKNPIGNTNIFYNSGLKLYADTGNDFDNDTVVFLNANESELPRGAILQLEKDEEGEPVATYNGSYYDLKGDDLVWQFSNSTIQNAEQPQPEPPSENVLYYNMVYEPPHSDIPLPMKWIITENRDNNQYWDILIFNVMTYNTLQGNKTYYVLADESLLPEGSFNFIGYYGGSDQEGVLGIIPKDDVRLVDINNPDDQRLTRQRNVKSKIKSNKLTLYKKTNNIKIYKQTPEDQVSDFKLEKDEIKLVQPETLIQQHTKIKAKSLPKKQKTYTNNLIEEDDEEYN